MREGYDVAQICQNGHVTNSSTINFPQSSKKFCDKCGAETIVSCPQCNFSVRGAYWGSVGLSRYTAPAFCINCGQPFPWTQAKLQAAHQLTEELDTISEEDRAMLQQSIDDLVRDTPSTSLAATRFKKIMIKAGQGTASIFRDILVDILSETTKKMLFP